MKLRSILLKSAWRALVPTALINVPLLGMIFLFLAYPVFSFFPELAESGDAITYIYAAAFLSSFKAWLVFYSYYFVLIVVLSIGVHYVCSRR